MSVCPTHPDCEAQQAAWRAATDPAEVAEWLRQREAHHNREISFDALDFKLRDRLLAAYKPTHCGCGKPLDNPHPHAVWDYDEPRIECSHWKTEKPAFPDAGPRHRPVRKGPAAGQLTLLDPER